MFPRFLFTVAFVLACTAHEASGATQRQGVLFRVSDGERSAWLYGTVHVGRPSFGALAPEVAAALSASRTLVLELDTRRETGFAEALARHATYPQGQDLLSRLDEPTRQKLKDAFARNAIDIRQLAHFKPWLIANLLVGIELHGDGFLRTYGLEALLLARAQEDGVAVAELESIDGQLAMFDSMGEAAALRYLDESLDGVAGADARELMDAWMAADAGRLEALHARLTSGTSASADFTRRLLLGKRNPEMADGIEKFLRAPGTSFIGVGVLHLLGAQGLPRLLAQRGYKVERIY